ncbi:LAFE_0B00804g1_1 [Lachancea fermentati]|uniref:Mediator of RNA polymerase II transcription subunit 14 n=1 Tax=Lachancea fermentati TaxID=4955 RepID=A0A1G4M793_LACFM|nr:LAFE_0B00804g1_1 [Lachancea fermentati]
MTTAVQDFKVFNGGGLQSNTSQKQELSRTSMTQRQDNKAVRFDPPEIPHVEFNQSPLSLIIRNLTVFTIKEIAQFFKTSAHQSQDAGTRKASFLQMIIYLRNQFLRLYVLIKWCKTIKKNNFNTMIDLLNWFRGSNMSVNNCIWALKNNLVSMANAKLPNPDLVTALEVLSLGRPNLPTHNLKLSGDEGSEDVSVIPAKLILKRIRDLNTLLSIRISLMELPDQFYQYKVRDGKLVITVEKEFEVQLSTVDLQSPLFFVDLKFLFNDHLPLNKHKLEKVINEALFKSSKPLFSLYSLLHKYVLSLQMYMIHVELLDLEINGKYSGGNLVHHYDAKKNMITLKYWLQSRLNGKCSAIIGVEGTSGNIILKWNRNGVKNEHSDVPTQYSCILNNLGNILNEITFNHSQMIKAELLSTGVFSEDEENPDFLLFHVPTTSVSVAPIQLKINLISGVFYVKNPSSLLQFYINQINSSSTTDELIHILGRLKLDKIILVLRNMFEKTGWSCNDVIKLNSSVTQDSAKGQKRILTRDLFIRLDDWPANWYLILSVVSSNSTCVIEQRIGKIKAIKGNWELRYLDSANATTSKLESMTYQKIVYLQKTILHRIVNHMIIDSLNELNISNKICSGDILRALPPYVSSTGVNNNLSIIAIELESFLEGSNALNHILESSMLLRIDYEKSDIKLFGKFKKDTKIIKYQCDELLIQFTNPGALSFYIFEEFTNLNNIVLYLTKFKQKLMQLVVLTDVIERLHNNFYSENFSIVALKPNEISFKYLRNSTDTHDCMIKIVTNDHNVENLDVKLSSSNPQYIVQPFIDDGHYDYHFIFNYLQFTSGFFGVLKEILSSYEHSNGYTTVSLQLHNLSEYELLYHNPETNTKITLIIELRNVSHNGTKKLQYYIHFSDDEHISTKSPAYPLVHQVRNTVFMIDNTALVNGSSVSLKKPKHPSAIKLSDGVSCDSPDIEGIIMEINDILKIDCM